MLTVPSLANSVRGLRLDAYFVSGSGRTAAMHQAMAATLDAVVAQIWQIQRGAREQGSCRAAALMIVLDSPKGWTWWTASRTRAPSARTRCRWWSPPSSPPEHLQQLEGGCASHRPEECRCAHGAVPELAALAPAGRAG